MTACTVSAAEERAVSVHFRPPSSGQGEVFRPGRPTGDAGKRQQNGVRPAASRFLFRSWSHALPGRVQKRSAGGGAQVFVAKFVQAFLSRKRAKAGHKVRFAGDAFQAALRRVPSGGS